MLTLQHLQEERRYRGTRQSVGLKMLPTRTLQRDCTETHSSMGSGSGQDRWESHRQRPNSTKVRCVPWFRAAGSTSCALQDTIIYRVPRQCWDAFAKVCHNTYFKQKRPTKSRRLCLVTSHARRPYTAQPSVPRAMDL